MAGTRGPKTGARRRKRHRARRGLVGQVSADTQAARHGSGHRGRQIRTRENRAAPTSGKGRIMATDYLALAQEAFDASTTFLDANYRVDLDYSLRAFRNERSE